MAKSLAGGFPLAAVTGRAEIMDAPGPGGLGGTYGGNPLGIAAAHAVLDVIVDEDLSQPCKPARFPAETTARNRCVTRCRRSPISAVPAS